MRWCGARGARVVNVNSGWMLWKNGLEAGDSKTLKKNMLKDHSWSHPYAPTVPQNSLHRCYWCKVTYLLHDHSRWGLLKDTKLTSMHVSIRPYYHSGHPKVTNSNILHVDLWIYCACSALKTWVSCSSPEWSHHHHHHWRHLLRQSLNWWFLRQPVSRVS